MTAPVIIGGGLAGLTVALAMAPRPVILLGRKSSARQTSSELAQGGMAAAMAATDSVESHVSDTLKAGAGLCDEAAVRSIVGEGPRAVEQLLAWGVPFDRDADGALRLGLEGAHSHRRVAHAAGDSTGATIMQTLVARAKATPSIRFVEGAAAALHRDGQGISGVTYHVGGDVRRLAARQVVLATGSACGLWRYASVPLASWGHGLVMAARVGAATADLEFVQFHPTALDVGADPLPLISEALRGEGAQLVTESGQRFIDELASRDVVARAIEAQRTAGEKVFLDARGVPNFEARFPTIAGICRQAGIDPARGLLPVRPAAHYHMGGVASDLDGQTNVPGLWACGECARTGLHGANRLASNSLLEGLVMGLRIARQMEAGQGPVQETQGQAAHAAVSEAPAKVRQIMSDHVGVHRTQKGLSAACEQLGDLAEGSAPAFAGLMIARAALMRSASCGAHDRE